MRGWDLFEEERNAFRSVCTKEGPVVRLKERFQEFRKDMEPIAPARDQRQRLLKGLKLLFNRKRIHEQS